ncbi:MAG: aminomethyl-transferring glycine dehydrogenase subunit GcvPB [Treponema sp.]|jgi:glycine dehydrogenase subunit 2|nr:aminomethyl-transferring glycine dehydrogenase subunit GcvPB [Treponema sp.]
MELIFEKSRVGRSSAILPPCDVPVVSLPRELSRKRRARLPNIDENSLSRHYSALENRSFGVNKGFYPLGSCTMKYNPKLGDEAAALPGFTSLHPLQEPETVRGCLKVFDTLSRYLRPITGMDAFSFQPAAGAQGELTGLLMIKAYHENRGDAGRVNIIIPDSAHGTNPASASMAGFTVINIKSGADGRIDLEALKSVTDSNTAGIMLTNPNTLGLFETGILEITEIVHKAGGLCYYDGANLNAVAGLFRPGDMGFDVMHVNLHKTFATPHGGGGPGSGPVGCKKILSEFLPSYGFEADRGEGKSIGRVHGFYGNFLVALRALAYLLMLGRDGVGDMAGNAVLNANYLLAKLKGTFPAASQGFCMHEFVLSAETLKEKYGVSALDIAKGLEDCGIHPPTVYFPLIVHEALMLEPTETESRETLDAAADVFLSLAKKAGEDAASLRAAPFSAAVSRPDEVKAARRPLLRYEWK